MSRRIRIGKTAYEKHLGKSVGSSRKRNMKRAFNKIMRQRAKLEIAIAVLSKQRDNLKKQNAT